MERSERYSGHESFVCRYGWLRKLYDAVKMNPKIFADDAIEAAIVKLGIGRNMVKSIAFWGDAFGIVEGTPPPARAAAANNGAAQEVVLIEPANAADQAAEAQVAAAPLVDVPYLVMNPACDLIRRPPEASVILIRGQFDKKASLPWPVDPEAYELIVIDDEEHVVSWHHKEVAAIPYKDLSKDLEDGKLRCVARMRPTYALKQQRILMSTLGRIGTDVPMHDYRRYSCDVWFRGANKACSSMLTLSGPELVALTSGRKELGHHLYFLPKAIDALREEAAKAGVHADTKAALDDLQVLRFLRGPISLSDDYKADIPKEGERISIKFPKPSERTDAKQLDGNRRVLLALFTESEA